jgi:hypothetical protein
MEMDPKLECTAHAAPLAEVCLAIRLLTRHALTQEIQTGTGEQSVLNQAMIISRSVLALDALGCRHHADVLIEQLRHEIPGQEE